MSLQRPPGGGRGSRGDKRAGPTLGSPHGSRPAILPRAGKEVEAPLCHTLIGPPGEAPLPSVICSGPGERIMAKQETTVLTASLQSTGVETELCMFLPDETGNSFHGKAL